MNSTKPEVAASSCQPKAVTPEQKKRAKTTTTTTTTRQIKAEEEREEVDRRSPNVTIRGARHHPSPTRASTATKRNLEALYEEERPDNARSAAPDADLEEEETGTPAVRELLSSEQDKYLDRVKKDANNSKQTAPFCLLKALFKAGTGATLTKTELKNKAEVFYGKPMVPPAEMVPLIREGFGAWSSIETLQKKQLVQRQKGGANGDRFWLTAQGWMFCDHLFQRKTNTSTTSRSTAPTKKQHQATLLGFFAKKK